MRALHLVIIASLLVLAGAAAGHPSSTPATSPAFDQDRYVEHRGDVVTVAATVPTGERVELRHEQPTGTATLSVRDDGDGRVRLRLNTYTGQWTAADNDEVSVVDGPVVQLPPAGTYLVSLNASGARTTAEIAIRPRSIERIGTWQVPENATSLDDAADVRDGIRTGTVRRAVAVNSSHRLVLQVDATGLAGAVAAADGANATERFRSAYAAHGDISVRQHPATVGTSQRAAILHVLDGPGVRVLPDARNDTYFVVVDPAVANLTRDGDPVATDRVAAYDRHGMQFVAEATLAPSSPLTDGRERARAVVRSRAASVTTDPDGRVNLAPAPDQSIEGGTNVGPGWNVSVVLTGEDDPSTDADESFRAVEAVTVTEPADSEPHDPGAFEATFDLRDVSEATNVTVDVRFDGRSLLEESVAVSVRPRVASVSAVSLDASSDFPAVRVNASLAAGGFVVLHAGSATGPIVGHTPYLSPGEHAPAVYVREPTDAERLVAVAHRDGNHNEWFDGPDVDGAYDRRNPSDAIEAGSTPTGAATASPSDASDGTDATDGTGMTAGGRSASSPGGGEPAEATTPGLGVSVALASLLGAVVVLGGRRRA